MFSYLPKFLAGKCMWTTSFPRKMPARATHLRVAADDTVRVKHIVVFLEHEVEMLLRLLLSLQNSFRHQLLT